MKHKGDQMDQVPLPTLHLFFVKNEPKGQFLQWSPTASAGLTLPIHGYRPPNLTLPQPACLNTDQPKAGKRFRPSETCRLAGHPQLTFICGTLSRYFRTDASDRQ